MPTWQLFAPLPQKTEIQGNLVRTGRARSGSRMFCLAARSPAASATISAALKRNVEADLSLRCWTKISRAKLSEICNLFWSLQKPAQDALLWSMQDTGEEASESESEDSGADVQTRKPWFLCGVRLCRRSFARFLGIGQARLQRTKTRWQGQDERMLNCGPSTRPALSTASVNCFMQKMYYSLSETMPTGPPVGIAVT